VSGSGEGWAIAFGLLMIAEAIREERKMNVRRWEDETD
jgi:hypothetical protein